MKRIGLVIFWVWVFILFLLPAKDPDLGWQLRCGQLIWQGRGFCSENQFSVLMAGYKWVNHAWGYQALLYPIYKVGGLQIVNSLLMTGAFILFYLALDKWKTMYKLLAIATVIFLGWGVFNLGIRSQELGFFFLCLVMFLVRKKPILLPLIMLLWANMHGSFMLGLLVILGIGKYKLFLLALIATLINPFGYGIYQEAFRHVNSNLAELIAEWVPPVPVIWWFILVVGIISSAYLFYKKSHWALGILVIAVMILALKARRSVPEFFLVVYFVQSVLEIKFKKIIDDLVILGFIALIIAIVVFRGKGGIDRPDGAIAYLQSQQAEGNIFNRYEWGGYLDWQRPEQKIFVDGRMPAWPTSEKKSPYTIYLETLQTQPGWQETLAKYNIQWILISPKTFMDLLLQPDPKKYGWNEVYRDTNSVVYKKL